jgi:outer membrane lipoprotein LolB
MRTDKFKIIVSLFAVCLSGCASMATQQPAQNHHISWDERAETLSAIQDWDLKAAIALHANKAAESGSLHWEKNGEQYSILIYGPLGASTIVMTGSPGKVELLTPQGKKFYASSPEILLAQQTGWHLPVSQLNYWIRGLPAPESPALKHFDSFNHLMLLEQQGWNIQYLRYMTVNHVDLPAKIFLNYPGLSVRIVITNWQIPQS